MADETGVGIDESVASNSTTDYAELTQAVKELVQVMHQGEIDRLEVSHGDLHILLCARSSNSSTPATPATSPAPSVPAAEPDSAEERFSNFHQITSPMVGTFYEAASPGEPPFVRPGDTVEAGQTVAIIEAMKIMNELESEVDGVVADLRDALPDELTQARWVIKERDEILERAQSDADRILEDARKERDRLVSQQEVVRTADAEAERVLVQAREQARRIRLEAEDYVDAKLANFEVVLSKTLTAVERGRAKLRGTTDADSLADDDHDEPHDAELADEAHRNAG
jgi:acetyl-CoA carboxylase biotin carboxyl carrier protein